MAKSRIILVGAGRSHMEAARQARRFARAGIDLTLVDPDPFWCSGPAAALRAGALESFEARIDPIAVMAGEGRFIRGRVDKIDLQAGEARLDDGRTLGFDIVSLNTGAHAAPPQFGGDNVIGLKPVSNLAGLRERLLAADAPMRVVVIGGGATGCEVAACLAALNASGRHAIALISDTAILAGWPARASRLAERTLRAAGVEIVRGEAREARASAVALARNGIVPADIIVLAAGLASTPEGVEAGPDGVAVDETLRWVEDSRVFALGDCAAITGHSRRKPGVIGARAAPVLIHNLISAATGRGRMRRFKPEPQRMSVLDMSDGTGILRYGGVIHRGPLAIWLNRRIEPRFHDRRR